MNFYNEELEKLSEQIDKKKHLKNKLESLEGQQKQLRKRVSELHLIMIEEQKDVEKLDGISLATLFYSIIGKKEAMLDAERKEAYAAAVKFETTNKELEDVEKDIIKCKSELLDLFDCEEKYNRLISEKTEEIKVSGNPISTEILQYEEELAGLKSQEKELNEAIFAGNQAKNVIDEIRNLLDDAESFGKWDLWGGGLVTDIMKHDRLDSAQSKVETLQIKLRKFKTELSDVQLGVDIKINIDGFLGFADFFFDDIFTNLVVMKQINSSKNTMNEIKHNILTVLNKLETSIAANQRKQKNIQKMIDELILKA